MKKYEYWKKKENRTIGNKKKAEEKKTGSEMDYVPIVADHSICSKNANNAGGKRIIEKL